MLTLFCITQVPIPLLVAVNAALARMEANNIIEDVTEQTGGHPMMPVPQKIWSSTHLCSLEEAL